MTRSQAVMLCTVKHLSHPRWPQITDAAKLTLASSVDTLVQNMSLLVLEELGRALAAALDAGTLELSALKEHWINILSNALVPILQNEHSPIMPGACDILSTIGNFAPRAIFWYKCQLSHFLNQIA